MRVSELLKTFRDNVANVYTGGGEDPAAATSSSSAWAFRDGGASQDGGELSNKGYSAPPPRAAAASSTWMFGDGGKEDPAPTRAALTSTSAWASGEFDLDTLLGIQTAVRMRGGEVEDRMEKEDGERRVRGRLNEGKKEEERREMEEERRTRERSLAKRDVGEPKNTSRTVEDVVSARFAVASCGDDDFESLWTDGMEEPERADVKKKRLLSAVRPIAVVTEIFSKKPRNNQERAPIVLVTDPDAFIDEDDIRPRFDASNIAANQDNAMAVGFGPALFLSSNEVSASVPAVANRYLRPYQREGVKFLYHNFVNRRGAILNDDMGLGKTIQIVAFLLAILKKSGSPMDKDKRKLRFSVRKTESNPGVLLNKSDESELKTVLIVVPMPVLGQWAKTLDAWGFFDYEDLYSVPSPKDMTRRDRRIQIINSCKAQTKEIVVGGVKKMVPSHPEILLATYELISSLSLAFREVEFSVIVFDEVHKLKNPNTQCTKKAQALHASNIKIGLTGTLMQNRFKEFWSVVMTVDNRIFPDWKVFDKKYVVPIKNMQQKSAMAQTVAVGQVAAKNLRDKLGPYLLRRTKALIRDDLPKKKENVVFCKLTPLQLACYQRLIGGPDADLVLRAGEECDCGRKMTRGKCCYTMDINAPLWKFQHKYPKNLEGLENILKYKECLKCPFCIQMPLMTKLIACCNHLELLKCPHDVKDTFEKAKFKAFEKFAFGNDADEIQDPTERNFNGNQQFSGKLSTLQLLLEVWRRNPKNRILIFSHYTKVLDLIAQTMNLGGFIFQNIRGETPAKVRTQIQEKFNDRSKSDSFALLISTKAGGLGLNLTGANIVVLFDTNWNPSHDQQAQDRAYRLGQFRNVDVFRLISQGTMEEVVYLRQVYKIQMNSVGLEGRTERRYFDGVIDDPDKKGELFGLKNLVQYKAEGHMQIMNKEYQWNSDSSKTDAVKVVVNKAVNSKKFTVHEIADVDDDVLQQNYLSLEEAASRIRNTAPAEAAPLKMRSTLGVAAAPTVKKGSSSSGVSPRKPKVVENIFDQILRAEKGDIRASDRFGDFGNEDDAVLTQDEDDVVLTQDEEDVVMTQDEEDVVVTEDDEDVVVTEEDEDDEDVVVTEDEEDVKTKNEVLAQDDEDELSSQVFSTQVVNEQVDSILQNNTEMRVDAGTVVEALGEGK